VKAQYEDLVGIVHLAPTLEMNESGELICVGISGYWAGEGGSPHIEDSAVFVHLHDALDWANQRGRTVYLRTSIDGPMYWYGDRDGDSGTAIPLVLEEAEKEFRNTLGRGRVTPPPQC
jgi:hypothetical protein